MNEKPCPQCHKPMSRTLDGSGNWTCLGCAKTFTPEEAEQGVVGQVFADLFGMRGGGNGK